MITLYYKKEKEIVFNLTKNPITNPKQSPEPEGKSINDIDPADPSAAQKRNAILNHPDYSLGETVVLKPGLNRFDNAEHAEYLYKTLGNPEVGGSIPLKDGTRIVVENKNILIEVDNEIKIVKDKENPEKEPVVEEKKDNFYRKYRQPVGMMHVAR